MHLPRSAAVCSSFSSWKGLLTLKSAVPGTYSMTSMHALRCIWSAISEPRLPMSSAEAWHSFHSAALLPCRVCAQLCYTAGVSCAVESFDCATTTHAWLSVSSGGAAGAKSCIRSGTQSTTLLFNLYDPQPTISGKTVTEQTTDCMYG